MEEEIEARNGGMVIQWGEKRLVLQILGPFGIPLVQECQLRITD